VVKVAVVEGRVLGLVIVLCCVGCVVWGCCCWVGWSVCLLVAVAVVVFL
jgi:hypothetical protein